MQEHNVGYYVWHNGLIAILSWYILKWMFSIYLRWSCGKPVQDRSPHKAAIGLRLGPPYCADKTNQGGC